MNSENVDNEPSLQQMHKLPSVLFFFFGGGGGEERGQGTLFLEGSGGW